MLVIGSKNKNKNKTSDRIFTTDTEIEDRKVNKRRDNKDDKGNKATQLKLGQKEKEIKECNWRIKNNSNTLEAESR